MAGWRLRSTLGEVDYEPPKPRAKRPLSAYNKFVLHDTIAVGCPTLLTSGAACTPGFQYTRGSLHEIILTNYPYKCTSLPLRLTQEVSGSLHACHARVVAVECC